MNHFKTRKIGWKTPQVSVVLTGSTGQHTPVVDLGGLQLLTIAMSTAAWAEGDLHLLGSVDSSSTAAQRRIFGSQVAGGLGSTLQKAVAWTTTASWVLSINPELTRGLTYIMLQSENDQAANKTLVLGLGSA